MTGGGAVDTDTEQQRESTAGTSHETTMESWSDLPDDLLHVVYAKVVGLLHRVRFAAVCRSWRDVAVASRHSAPPPLPWRIPSTLRYGDKGGRKCVYCPEDGEFLDIRVPREALGKRFVGAHDGGWVACQDVQLVVVNLYSGIEVPLSLKQRKIGSSTSDHDKTCVIRKIVFSKEPTTSGCILAALTYTCGVALCKVGGLNDDGWIMKREQGEGSSIVDITFFNGDLYGLTKQEQLVKFNISDTDGTISMITQFLPLQESGASAYINRLFELDGKLAMATRTWWSWKYNTNPLFQVFELTNDHQGNTLKWVEIMSLNTHALFLGETFSKAIRMSSGRRGQVEGNCIYGACATYFSDGGRVYDGQEESGGGSARRFKVAGYYSPYIPEDGIWLTPPHI